MTYTYLNWSRLSEAGRQRALARPSSSRPAALASQVAATLAAVRNGGDAALRRLTRRFDKVDLGALKVSPREFREARLSGPDLAALKEAVRRVRLFHERQFPRPYSVETSPGVRCERRFVPLSAVGLYVPGGSAPLPSTVVMLGVPAAVAGCPVRALATPPRRDGSVHPAILAAARLVGITDVYKVGGAQAIAALAYGTASVPKADKLFGPGNPWVTEAKLQVSRDPGGAACDFPAGPSEVLVIADAAADPAFAAADLLAQAEHGPDSQVVLVSDSRRTLASVATEVEKQLPLLARAPIARAALAQSRFIRVKDIAQAVAVSDRYAPEHLILHVASPRRWLPRVTNAGSVFLGPWSPESVGDYAAGPNHCLPTYGAARAYGGLCVEGFMKSMTVSELTPRGLRGLGPAVERLAALEGLGAHGNSVTLRLKRLAARR